MDTVVVGECGHFRLAGLDGDVEESSQVFAYRLRVVAVGHIIMERRGEGYMAVLTLHDIDDGMAQAVLYQSVDDDKAVAAVIEHAVAPYFIFGLYQTFERLSFDHQFRTVGLAHEVGFPLVFCAWYEHYILVGHEKLYRIDRQWYFTHCRSHILSQKGVVGLEQVSCVDEVESILPISGVGDGKYVFSTKVYLHATDLAGCHIFMKCPR